MAPEVTQGTSEVEKDAHRRQRITCKESCVAAPKVGPKAVGTLGRGQTGSRSHREQPYSIFTLMGSRETDWRWERRGIPKKAPCPKIGLAWDNPPPARGRRGGGLSYEKSTPPNPAQQPSQGRGTAAGAQEGCPLDSLQLQTPSSITQKNAPNSCPEYALSFPSRHVGCISL